MSYFNYSSLYTSCVPDFGGNYRDGSSAGAFYLGVNCSAAGAAVCGRLMFL